MKKKGRIVLIIQARMGSTRLPGKSMLPLAGEPLVRRLLERMKRCRRVDEIVLAIPAGKDDDCLETLAEEAGVHCFRGSEEDVLDRYYRAAVRANAGIVLRLPADNPVADPAEIDRIASFHSQADCEFSTNLSPTLGSGYPDGIGAEAIDFWAIEEAWRTSKDPAAREHPHLNFIDYTASLAVNPRRFRIAAPKCPAEFARPDLVLDVNDSRQYAYIAAMYDYLYPRNPAFGIIDIMHWNDRIWRPKAEQERNAARPISGRIKP